MNFKDSYQQIFQDKKKILVVFAHPDDAEIYCGGTIAKLTQDSKRVRIVKMTFGNRGSRQEIITEAKLKKIREKEDKKSMQVLGIKPEDNIYLGFHDGEVDNNLPTIEKIAWQIRDFQPDLIITHNPEGVIIRFDKDINWVNHRDHRNTGKSTIDAAYPYSRDTLFFPDQLKKLKTHGCVEFLLVDYYQHEDCVQVDITGFEKTRTKAIASHSSQYTPKHAQISTDFFTKRSNGKYFEKFRYVIAD